MPNRIRIVVTRSVGLSPLIVKTNAGSRSWGSLPKRIGLAGTRLLTSMPYSAETMLPFITKSHD